MKKIILMVLLLATVLTMTACGGKKETQNPEISDEVSEQKTEITEEMYKIPNIFGIHYSDAKDILEDEGFEVKTVETSVAGISEKLDFPLENVEKGIVFKIDDYILDSKGRITKNYSYYGDKLDSEDKSIVIYYAKEDYLLNKEESESPAPESTDTTALDTTLPPVSDTSEADAEGIDPEFKAAMDSYESFMNEYVEFMKKYMENPTDLSLLSDYADYMSKYSDFVEDFSKWENEEMNAAETAYYIDVQTRVNKKLLEIA